MSDFIGESTALRAEVEEASASASAATLPDTAAWAALAAPFALPESEAAVPVTVGTEVPLEPYGAPVGALRRWLRRLARKAVRWYVEPLVERQNAVNRTLLATIEEQRRRIDELEAEARK